MVSLLVSLFDESRDLIYSVAYLDLAGLITTKGTGPACTSSKVRGAGFEVIHASLKRVRAGCSNGHGGQSKDEGGSDNLGELHVDGGSCCWFCS